MGNHPDMLTRNEPVSHCVHKRLAEPDDRPFRAPLNDSADFAVPSPDVSRRLQVAEKLPDFRIGARHNGIYGPPVAYLKPLPLFLPPLYAIRNHGPYDPS